MSLDPFPERIDPRKLFVRNGAINGEITLSKLPRLSEYLSSSKGQIEASLHFSCDENNRRLVSGVIKAQVSMLCQRCLEGTLVELESTLNVLVLSDKQWNNEVVRSLSADIEAVHASEDELDVLALIEDELILSLPTVAYHDERSCSHELNELKALATEHNVGIGNNAFASLQALKNELNKD